MNNDWPECIDAWVLHLRAGGHPPTTIRLRTQHLRQLAETHPRPWSTTTSDLTAWMASHDWKPNTMYSVRSSLRSFYGWAAKAGHIPASPAEGLPSVKRPDPNPHPMPTPALSRAMSLATERERLILLLATRCGMRRGEIARAHSRDLTGEPGCWSLTVLGKGQKVRSVPVADDVAEKILDQGEGFLFPGQVDGHLSPDWVGVMVSRMLPEGVSLHAGRHRFATRAFGATRDIATVQRLLGHASPSTTLAYVQMPDDAMRRAMMAAS